MSVTRILSAALFLGVVSLASAQAPSELPDLDLWDHGAVFTTDQESSGDLLIGGLFNLAGGLPRNNLARVLLPDEVIDPDFSPQVNGPVFVVLQQTDGKILIGGQFTQVNGTNRSNLARLNANGTLDTGWNPGANQAVYVLELDGPDHVIVGGSFSNLGGTTRRGLGRLALATAQVDGDWNPDVRGGSVFALAFGASDFWIGGSFNQVGGQPSLSLARLSSAGNLVTAHTVDGTVESLSFDSSNGLYLCGRFATVDSSARSRLARLGLDGLVDSFSITVDQDVHDCRSNNGEVLIGGQFQEINGEAVAGAARLSAGGIVDTDFRPAIGGVYSGTQDTDVLIWRIRDLGNDRTFVGGVFRKINGENHVGAALLNSVDGDPLDTIHVERPAEVRTMVQFDDGALLVGGGFWRSGEVARDNLLRVQTDGNLDSDWTLPVNGSVLSAALLNDGNLVLGGFFSSVDEQARRKLARVNLGMAGPEVEPDWTAGTNGAVLVIQQDRLDSDRLYVAGNFTELEAADQIHPRGAMARLSLAGNGSPDNFNPGFDAQVNDLLQVPSSDRLYMAGFFNQAAGQMRRGIAAFSDAGGPTQLELDFNAASNGSLWVLHAAADESSFYAGGEFTSLFGSPRAGLAKVGPNFDDWAPTANGTPVAMALDGLGGLYVGGTFNNLNGTSRSRLGRLDASAGSLDLAFNPGAQPGLVWDLQIGPGRLLAAGSFQVAGGLPRRGLAAFEVDTPVIDEIFFDRFEQSGSRSEHGRSADLEAAEWVSEWKVECVDELMLTGRDQRPAFRRAPGCN